jgi:hypothetical protein
LPIKLEFGRNQPQTVHAQPSNDSSLRQTNSLPSRMQIVYADSFSIKYLGKFKLHH